MIKPIHLYGKSILREVCREVQKGEESIEGLIQDLFDTVKNAAGIGLAAPQIGVPLSVFVIDTIAFEEEGRGVRKVFINPQILEESGKAWGYKEGCLSLPGLQETIYRQPDLRLNYWNENFEPHTEVFSGMMARIIQHEYDHLKGILFTDKLVGLKRVLAQKKLKRILERKVTADYLFS